MGRILVIVVDERESARVIAIVWFCEAMHDVKTRARTISFLCVGKVPRSYVIVLLVKEENYIVLWMNSGKVLRDVPTDDCVTELYAMLCNIEVPNTVFLSMVVRYCALFVDVMVQLADVTPVAKVS